MAIIAYPLNNTDYTAEDAMLATLPISSGVYAAENNFNISIVRDLTASIGIGLAFIRYATAKGFTVYMDEPQSIVFDYSDPTLPRIDRVVLRWTESENAVTIAIKKGTPSSSPVPVARATDPDVYELVLYDVRIGAGVTSLSSAVITDQRLDESLCGLMANTITKLNTATYDAQIKTLLNNAEKQMNTIIANAESNIEKAVNTQLQEAKDSGQFKGDKGEKGDPGTNGKTPVRGTDYWTTADQTAIINAVLANFTDVSEVGM